MNLPGLHLPQFGAGHSAPVGPHTPRIKIVRRRPGPIVPIATEPAKPLHRQGFFHKLTTAITAKTGSPIAFVVAVSAVVIWAIAGPFCGYSNTWQLTINTGTTIITFLMVFAIQGSQNRDAKAVQLKLDELIRTGHGSDEFVDLEDLEDSELDALHIQFKDLHEKIQARRDNADQKNK